MSKNFYLGRSQKDPPSLEIRLHAQLLFFCSLAGVFALMVFTYY